MKELLLGVLCFPLLGFLITGLGGKRLNKGLISILNPGVIGLSFVFAVITFIRMLGTPPNLRYEEFHYFTWLKVGSLEAPLGILLDPLSMVMMLVVTGVSFVIHIYSVGYMGKDPGYSRYFAYLNLFVFFMLLLVLANNYPLMFVGWEGVGLCSYLLIGFWFSDEAKAKAGMKAFVVNRIGDFGFLIGLFLLWKTFQTFTFSGVAGEVLKNISSGVDLPLSLIALTLFIGATGKSAQIPLYVWLPDAMAGPTPVSALIHAATMVTAGVYMVARNHFIYVHAPQVLTLIAWVGMLTALFAATIALVQNDIKKVLAYSTISQLGYMFAGCGVGAFSAGIAHLMTHAYFKALLFLGAGAVIHSIEHAYHRTGYHGDPQDIRYMGGLKVKLPITFWTFLTACLAIAGIPGLSGFFSKDEILWRAFSSGQTAIGVVGMVAAGLTAFYMFRLIFLVFYGQWRGERAGWDHLHESPPVMTIPLIILAVLSVGGGWVAIPHALGGGAWFEEFLKPVFSLPGRETPSPESHGSLEMEYVVMVCSVLVALVGIWWARRWYISRPEAPQRVKERWALTYQLLLNKYYVDEAYAYGVVQPTLTLAEGLDHRFDSPIIDGVVNGVGAFLQRVGSLSRKIQTGVVTHYALVVTAGIVIWLGWLLFRSVR